MYITHFDILPDIPEITMSLSLSIWCLIDGASEKNLHAGIVILNLNYFGLNWVNCDHNLISLLLNESFIIYLTHLVSGWTIETEIEIQMVVLLNTIFKEWQYWWKKSDGRKKLQSLKHISCSIIHKLYEQSVYLLW